jgi:hypothetical protein
MNEERMTGSPDRPHVRPWLCPGRPGIDYRHVPAAHPSRLRVAMTPLAPAGHTSQRLDQLWEAFLVWPYRVRTAAA